MVLDSRSKEILQYLLTQYDYISVDALMKEFQISRRTTYYAIQKLNEWLQENRISEIEVERNKGIFLTSIQKNKIDEALYRENQKSEYAFSAEKRIQVMICLIIQSSEKITVEYLMKIFEVSRNTVFADLKEIGRILNEYHLTLSNEQKKGYYISGDTIKIRAVFFLYVNMLYPLIKDGFIKFFEDENIKENMILLKKIEQELNVSFVEGTLEALAALLPIMEKNEDTIEIKGISHDKITETLEYYLVQKYFTYLSSEECCYLTLHLLGSRLQSIDNGVVQYSEDEETRELTKILVSEFKRVACVEFENQIEIERALFAHLRTSMYRYKYGIQLGNLMLEDIKKQYSSLFEITKKASEVLTLHIGVPIPDSEIAYLTLHFGGFLRAMKTKVNTLHIVVVCPNGVSTGNMIKGEIRTLLPNANVVKAVSVNEFERGTWDCDFVISTVPLKTTIPLIVVHPILTDIDRIQILKRSMSKTTFQNKQADVDALFNIMKNYVAKDQYKNVYKDLKKYLESLNQFEQISLKPVMNSLMDFLDVSHIYIEEEKMNWISAIHKACDSLIEEKVITANYCSSIISQLQVYGPYMFITQNVVLAHAKSEDGAIRLACNLVVFKQKVAFAPGREAKIVMVLSAPDSQSHLEVLKNINQIFSIATNADAIFECASAEEIQKKMYEMLNIC